MNLGPFGKRSQDELLRMSAGVGDLRLEAASLEGLHGLLEAGTVGRHARIRGSAGRGQAA